jgi:hypothetical protein
MFTICQRCNGFHANSPNEAEAVARVKTKHLDLLVCADCKAKALELGLYVIDLGETQWLNSLKIRCNGT